ncbi:MAG: hypothetical protein AAF645_23660 [Myxococcota bacterium]
MNAELLDRYYLPPTQGYSAGASILAIFLGFIAIVMVVMLVIFPRMASSWICWAIVLLPVAGVIFAVRRARAGGKRMHEEAMADYPKLREEALAGGVKRVGLVGGLHPAVFLALESGVELPLTVSAETAIEVRDLFHEAITGAPWSRDPDAIAELDDLFTLRFDSLSSNAPAGAKRDFLRGMFRSATLRPLPRNRGGSATGVWLLIVTMLEGGELGFIFPSRGEAQYGLARVREHLAA